MSTTTATPTPFMFSSPLKPYNTSPASYLAANPTVAGLIVSAVIIHNNRALLIQRAAHDGFPLKWECPGGGADMTDASILHALCREVQEETGLVVTHVVDVVDTLDFVGSRDSNYTTWRKITFLVALGEDGGEERMPVVKLNANEHVDAVWAAENEILVGRAEGREIAFAYDAQRQTVLDALRSVYDRAEAKNE